MGRRPADGGNFIRLIDQTYLAFGIWQRRSKATCRCKACQEIPALDLKFMVHHGDFIVQQVAGIKDLLGSDVNLVHRLLKNSVTEITGWRGYALFTLQGLEHLQADKKAFLQQSESYEHLGNVETYVVDMHARYKSMKASSVDDLSSKMDGSAPASSAS
jgi:hypothetical protein